MRLSDGGDGWETVRGCHDAIEACCDNTRSLSFSLWRRRSNAQLEPEERTTTIRRAQGLTEAGREEKGDNSSSWERNRQTGLQRALVERDLVVGPGGLGEIG